MTDQERPSSGWWMILTNALACAIAAVNQVRWGAQSHWCIGFMFSALVGLVIGAIVVALGLPRRYTSKVARLVLALVPGILASVPLVYLATR